MVYSFTAVLGREMRKSARCGYRHNCRLLFLRWKDPKNAFRTHPKLLLKGVPTLLQWDTVCMVTLYYTRLYLPCCGCSMQAKKLVEDDCANEELVKMLFEED